MTLNWTPGNGRAPLVRQYGTAFCPLTMWLLAVMYHAFPEVASQSLPPFFLA